MKLKIKRAVVILCVVATVFSLSFGECFARLEKAGRPTMLKSFVSSYNFDDESLSVDTVGKYSISINFNTPIKTDVFNLSLYRIGKNGGNIGLDINIIPETYTDESGRIFHSFSKKLNMKSLEVPDGSYYLYIRRAVFDDENRDLESAKFLVISNNMELRVKKGRPYIAVYDNVRNYNDKVRGWASIVNRDLYLDNSLDDIRFVLRDPMTREYSEMYQYKQDYIKSVADRICSGAENDYEKIRRIYEYTAENFYYDIIAFREKALQYADPYQSIYNFENKLSSVNSVRGVVHITCQGYSAIFIALARSQGIPSRMIFGHHLSVPSNNWTTEEYKMSLLDHWWAEAYVGGRWVMIDCTTGTTNQYNKHEFSTRERGLTNYALFDPSKEMAAMGHVYMNVYPDFRRVKYLTNQYDINTLRDFYDMNGNGRLLKSSYSPNDLNTWGSEKHWHSFNDGWGNIANLVHKKKGLSGDAVLARLKSLARLDLRNNKLTSVDLSGDGSLVYAKLKGNPLKKAIINIDNIDRSFHASENGTFSFDYVKAGRKPLTIFSKADLGYKLEGIYNKTSGSKVSGRTSVSISPSGAEYEVRFALNPDSYYKTIFREGNADDVLRYIKAAAKRLSQLGYYNPYYPAPGEETYYSSQMSDAIYKFQIVNCIEPTYNIDEATWRQLFSENAAEYVGDFEYWLMLEAYKKYLEEQAAADETSSATETDLMN